MFEILPVALRHDKFGAPDMLKSFAAWRCFVRMTGSKRGRARRRAAVLRLCHIPFVVSITLIAPSQPQAQTTNQKRDEKEVSSRQQADTVIQQGMLLLHEKRYGEALAEFRLLEKQSPLNPDALSGEGIALALMGRSDEAIDTLKRALAVDPSYWLARRELGILYWSKGRKQDAAGELEPLIVLHPDDGPVNSILGQYELERKSYPAALAYFSRIPAEMAADPSLALMGAEAQLNTRDIARAAETLKDLVGRPDLTNDMRFKLAWMLGQAKLSKEAIQEFNKLPTDYPDRFRRNYGLALAYFNERDYQKCIQTLKPVLATGRTEPELYSLLGVAEEKSGQTQEAYEAFREGILQNPTNPRNYLNIATLASQHLNYKLAAEMLTEGIARIPQAHELFLSRGIAYTLAARFDEAKRDYQRAIEMAPEDYGGYLAMGISELEEGNLNGAIQSLRKAAVHGTNDPRCYYFLTESLIQKGAAPGGSEFQEALESINTAVSLEPNFAHAYVDRAKLELARGDAKTALVDLEHARSIDPNSSSIAYLLARAYQRKGERAKADALFAQVQEQGDRDLQQFAKDSLTETLVVVSTGNR